MNARKGWLILLVLFAGCGSTASADLLQYLSVADSDQQRGAAALRKYGDCTVAAPTATLCSTEAAAIQTDIDIELADLDKMKTPACLQQPVGKLKKNLQDERVVFNKVQAAFLIQDADAITATFPALDKLQSDIKAINASIDKASC